MSLSLTLAWRYFRARRETGLISVVTGFSIAGLAIGVAALILTMAVFTGFRLELRDRLFRLEGPIKVVHERGGAPFIWQEAFGEALAGTPGVAGFATYLNAPSIVFKGDTALGAVFRGFGPEGLGPEAFTQFMVAGELSIASEGGQNRAVIGTGLAARLDLKIGDEFRAYEALPEGSLSEGEGLPASQAFLVTGLFDSGVAEVDRALILTSAQVATAFTPLKAEDGAVFYDGALVYLEDNLRLSQVLADLPSALLETPLVPRSVLDSDPGNLGFTAAQHLALAREQEAAMVVILALIIVVAAFGVIAGQMMKVREKSREIAVLRSFGASQGLIVQVFLLLGLLIGGLGAGIGGGVGLVLAWNLDGIRLFVEGATGLSLFPADQFRLAFLPSRPTGGTVVLACLIALLLTLAAMAYPAMRAAKLSPAEALRYG